MNTLGDRVSRFTRYKEIDEEKKKRNTVNDVRNDVKTKRSNLDRGLDLISVGQYVSAGIAKGIVDDESTVLGNIATAFEAANPFGQGNEAGEHSFSDVIEEAGWKPESLGGKIAKGTVGFLGDVFLDPTTYLTLGLGAALKGGKGALQAAKVTDKLIDIDKATDVVRKFAASSGEEMSEDVIKSQAEKLLTKHNKLMGLNETPKALELSLANAPFGNKIFGNLSQAKKTIATGEDIAKLGDKTIAPVYQKLRSDLMKTKFADMFSKNSRLYKIALEEPDELYKFMRSEVMQKRHAGNLIKEKKLIMAQAAKLKNMNFTPEESKQIMDLLQDPATRRVIYNDGIKEEKNAIEFLRNKLNTVERGFSDYMSEHIVELKDLEDLKSVNLEKQNEILRKISDSYEEFSTLTKEFDVQKQQLDELIGLRKKEIIDDIASVPTPTLSLAGKLPEVNKIITKDLDEIQSVSITKEKIDIKGLFEAATKEIEIEESAIKNIAQDLKPELDINVQGITKQMSARIRNQINKNGYVVYKDKKSAEAFIAKSKGWSVQYVDDEIRVIPPKTVMVDDVSVQLVNKNNRNLFIDSLNKNYGFKISTFASNSMLNKLHKVIIEGGSRENLEKVYNQFEKQYTGYNTILNKHLAKEFGYKSYKNQIDEPLTELRKKIDLDKGLTESEEREYSRLLKIARGRSIEKYNLEHQFKTFESLNKFITDKANKALELEMNNRKGYKRTKDELISDAYDEKRLDFTKDGKQTKVDARGKALPDRPDRYIPELGKDEMEFVSVDAVDLLGYAGVKNKSPLLLKQINDIISTVPEVMKEYHFKQIATDTAGYTKRKFPYIDELPENIRKTIYKQAKDKVTGKISNKEWVDVIKKYSDETMIKEQIEDVVELTTKIDSIVKKPLEYTEMYATDVEKFANTVDVVAEKTQSIELLDKRISELYNVEDSLGLEYDSLIKQSKELDDMMKQSENFTAGKFEELSAEKLNYVNQIEAKERAIKRHESFLDSVGITPDRYEEIEKLYKLDGMDIDDKVKEAVHLLRDSFLKIGTEEVGIGKMKREAFESWANSYLPHILTDEGADFIRENASKVNKALPGFDAKKIGYGRVFNPFTKERTLKNIKLNGEFIANPNIDQLNEFFQQNFPELKDNKVFIDDVTDLYIKRALKHVDVMYDHKYMNEMLGMLGTKFTGNAIPGQKLVMNFGVLRDNVLAMSKKEFGQTWDEFDVTNQISEKLASEFGKGTEEYMKGLSEAKYNYMEEIGGRILKNNYNLPPNALTDLSTPMIELTPDQAKYIHDLTGGEHEVFSVNDLIVDKANQSRKYQIQKDNNQMLNMFDKFTHFIKLNQTTVKPGFHIRNKIGNMFNNYLAIGQDAVNPRFQAIAHNVLMKKGDVDDMLIITKKDGTKVEKSWREIYEAAQQYGILDEGFFEKDLGTTSASAPDLFGIPKKFNPFNTREFVLYEAGAKVGTHVEGMDKLIHFASQLSRGMDYQEAYESANKYLFNYGDLTFFEQSVMKRIFPYYTWLRKNAPLQLETMLENPGLYRNINKVLRGVTNMNNQEDRMEDKYTAAYAQDWVQTPFTSKEGNPIIMNPSLPQGDVNRIPDISDLGGSFNEIMSQVNPILKVPTEFATNKNFFLDKEIFEEDKNAVLTGADYIMSQGAYYNTIKNLIKKDGTDRALQILNELAGVKFSEYEYEKYKGIMQSGGWKND